jgi:hypothetical protein
MEEGNMVKVHPSEPTAQVVVEASDGISVYHVTHFKGYRTEWECECATWRAQRRPCKHMALAKLALKSKQKPTGVCSVWKGV